MMERNNNNCMTRANGVLRNIRRTTSETTNADDTPIAPPRRQRSNNLGIRLRRRALNTDSTVQFSDSDDDNSDQGEEDGNNKNDTSLRPPARLRSGDRTVSTALRLESQGWQESINRRSSFAVRSIQRNSSQWSSLLKPFVSDLVFRSISSRKYDNVISFRPYTCQAALLFVDLSGYSRITAAIAHKGAHVISAAVNAYLKRLLEIIYTHGGDVIKFAGDAILVVWEGDEQELEINVLCAARCVLELQTKAGEHTVEGTSLKFQIHCGLCCGILESEIFEAPVHNNMQRLYHYVGGESMEEIGDLVDLAKAGETATSRNCLNFLETGVTYEDCQGADSGAKLLKSFSNDDRDLIELMDWHIEKTLQARQARRNRDIEEDFIHPTVLAYLTHGGLSPTHIAQMRNLCVLFIAMTSKGSSVNWLMEIQAILDKNRCPIVQIIFDDKGVHVVAAVNLYEAVPEASVVGLEVCRELVDKRVGAAVGAALGPTFCGVTGSNTACRWDITGPAVVRAARLMQYALQRQVDFAIDQSLYDDPMAATRLLVLDAAVPLKGSAAPITVYTISDSKSYSAFRILENVHGGVHNEKVQEIQNHINSRVRSAVVVTGIPMAGMRIVCQRAAGYSDLVPFLHLCEVSAGFVQLARTIATWFQYVDDDEVKRIANSVMEDMSSGCWSCAHDQCVRLVNTAIGKGFHACFIVDRIQVLDKFSLSLIRECLKSPRQRNFSDDAEIMPDPTPLQRSLSSDSADFDPKLMGQICFLCVHNPLYSSVRAKDLVQDLARSHTSFKIGLVEIGEARKSELRALIRDLSDIEVGDRWLEAYAEASGYCAEYFLERAEAVRNLSAELWKEGKPALVETSEDLVLHISPGLVCRNKELKVTEIRAETAMRFSQIFDEIPPLCQTALKILCIATRNGLYRLPYRILWEAMNDLIAQGVERNVLDILLEEMIDICVIKVEDWDEKTTTSANDDGAHDQVYSIQNPALADIVMDVCTPIQVCSIAKVLIDRLQAVVSDCFQVSLVIAGLHSHLDHQQDGIKHLWLQAYQGFQQTAQRDSWSQCQISKWKEIINDEIRRTGLNAADILPGFSVSVAPRQRVSPCIAMVKIYSAPVALGPLGLSLSVLCRNTFHEYGIFHGACSREEAEKLWAASGSACGRYMMEMSVLENQLREMGAGAPLDEVEAEMEMISFLAKAAECKEEVETKAVLILEEVIPRFVEHRLHRLHKLVAKLKEDGKTPDFIANAEKPLRLSYEALQSSKKSRMDAAQDALMILATMNWKPKSIPEYLPLAYQQTVANIRNKTLKRLTDVEVVMFRHQQTVDDLEAFLVVTPLLHQASKDGLC